MFEAIKMEYSSWVDLFCPKKNLLDNAVGFDGFMFETFGKNFDFVISFSKKQIWSLIKKDKKILIVNDLYQDQVFGYFVTDKEWNSKLEIYIDTSKYMEKIEGAPQCGTDGWFLVKKESV